MTDYCTAADLMIGDLQIPSSVDTNVYIARACRDIDIALGERYVTPIVTLNVYTTNLLKNVAADLASAYLVLAQAQGHEDNLPNAYGIHLWNRAKNALQPFIDGKPVPGATLLASRTDDLPISVRNEDAASLLGAFETFVTTPNPYAGEFYGPWTGRYGDGFQ